MLNVLRRRGGAELTRQAARKAHPLALDVAAGVAKESKRPGKVAELDADLLQQRLGVAFDRLEAFFAQNFRERDVARDVRDGRMRAMGARGPARLAAASWLLGGGRSGIRHGFQPFPTFCLVAWDLAPARERFEPEKSGLGITIGPRQ